MIHSDGFDSATISRHLKAMLNPPPDPGVAENARVTRRGDGWLLTPPPSDKHKCDPPPTTKGAYEPVWRCDRGQYWRYGGDYTGQLDWHECGRFTAWRLIRKARAA